MILNVSSKDSGSTPPRSSSRGMEVAMEVEKLEPVRGVIRWTCGEDLGGLFSSG